MRVYLGLFLTESCRDERLTDLQMISIDLGHGWFDQRLILRLINTFTGSYVSIIDTYGCGMVLG